MGLLLFRIVLILSVSAIVSSRKKRTDSINLGGNGKVFSYEVPVELVVPGGVPKSSSSGSISGNSVDSGSFYDIPLDKNTRDAGTQTEALDPLTGYGTLPGTSQATGHKSGFPSIQKIPGKVIKKIKKKIRGKNQPENADAGDPSAQGGGITAPFEGSPLGTIGSNPQQLAVPKHGFPSIKKIAELTRESHEAKPLDRNETSTIGSRV
ncbi:hypothetical protein Y032_0014g2386 [Ancylostoma ceylanicum]|uniref:Uncharacterized protein n=1 Tax=Ancylostoma ceylanicum TaxID=53326 RepID=A0A016V9V1_9BILA|nr:hypothetical protein Y032_0014g2386 [Ancylostoma ceylanicum]